MLKKLRLLALMSVLLISIVSNCYATRYFVNGSIVGGASDGSSWTDAFTDLQDALGAAVSGDEIWVASGTYKPTQGTDQTISFSLPADVLLFGGFKGDETFLLHRDYTQNVTILSGDIGVIGDYTDNSNHVVEINSVNGLTRLDGFTITSGYANGVDNDKNGGGIFCENADDSLTIANCIITDNRAGDGVITSDWATSSGGHGGGIYLNLSSPTIENCLITQNTTGNGIGASWAANGGNGGGIYALGSFPTIEDSTISYNSNGMGGDGQLARDGGNGGGIYFESGGSGEIGTVTIKNCVISDNTAGMGGDDGGTYRTDRCGTGGGGGAFMVYGEMFMNVYNTTFSGNKAGKGGEASAVGPGGDGGFGGAINLMQTSELVFHNCSFIGNSAGGGGDGPSGYPGGDGGTGGVFYGRDAIIKMFNCNINGNTAGAGGNGYFGGDGGDCGGIYLWADDFYGILDATNCTIVNNSAGVGGIGNVQADGSTGEYGGIYLFSNGVANIINSILWGNSVNEIENEDTQISKDDYASININYSCLEGWTTLLGGTGNIGFDPLFVDPLGIDGIAGTEDDDVRIDAMSPCIDSASDGLIPEDIFDLDNDGNITEQIQIDLIGEIRILDDPFTEGFSVDMGAYEFALDCNGNGIQDYKEIEGDPSLDENDDGVLNECSNYVSDELVPPVGADLSVEPPMTFSGSQAFYHPYEHKVFANEPGLVAIEWSVPDATTGLPVTVVENYVIVPTQPTVLLYRNDSPNEGPIINLQPIYQAQAEPIVHYNSTIEFRSESEYESTPPDADAYVYLKGLYGSKAGQFLLEYRDRDTDKRLLGFEVVQIKDTIPMYIQTEVGDQLLPSGPGIHDISCEPNITQGYTTNYVYEQTEAGPTKWFVFPIRPTDSLADIEIYWYKQRELRIEGIPLYVNWPSELCRYIVDWPVVPQLNLVGSRADGDDIPVVDMSQHTQVEIKYQAPPTHVDLRGSKQLFYKSPGWSTIMYTDEVLTGKKVSFDVVKTINHNDNNYSLPKSMPWDIGKRIEDSSHAYDFFVSGYVFQGTNYDPDIYDVDIFNNPADHTTTDDQAIIPVNKGNLEVWWYEESTTRQGEPSGVAWPYQSTVYNCDWPEVPDGCIIICNEMGIGPFGSAAYYEPSIYSVGTIDSDPTEIGYNPNEEHAEWEASPGDKIFAARDDLNELYNKSEPYVLLKYNDLLEKYDLLHEIEDPWEIDVIRVARTGASASECPCQASTQGPCDFVYSVTAGQNLRPPMPLALPTHDPSCGESTLPYYSWFDNRGKYWYKRGGVSTSAYYYERWEGECTPWLDTDLSDGLIDDPQPVVWEVEWPTYAQSTLPPGGGGVPIKDIYIDLEFGETRIRDLATGVRMAEILYNEPGASLIRPWKPSYVDLASTDFPPDYLTVRKYLPPHIQERLGYDEVNQKLYFMGDEDLGLLGIMSPAERDIIKTTFLRSENPVAFNTAVDDLYAESQQEGVYAVGTIVGPDNPDWGIAISAGSCDQQGWVVLGYNGANTITELSDVEVFKVECPLHTGEINVIYPECFFDEQLTLRWSGDCSGDCGPIEFRWQYAVGERPEYDDIDPNSTPAFDPDSQWRDWVHDDGSSGWQLGRNEVIIGGDRNPLFTLTDNWFRVSIRVPDSADYPNEDFPDYPCPIHTSSEWTDAQLAEGWLKRVKRGLNPFDQRVSDFSTARVATYVSMIEQLGNPYMDRVGLTCDPDVINSLGLIEMYQAVLFRAKSFTIDNRIDYMPANQALILFAGSLADFYMLLANEAYGDSIDPTIGIDVNTSESAGSLFCFQDQLPTNENSLLYEELALLRGRDGRSGTAVDRFPVYNRLYWNFTLGDGQVAYKNNYNIQDVYPTNDDGSRGDGFIDAGDAETMFPQGHGDAWGHYLSAMSFYYELLRHQYYSWPIRTEAVLVDQVPVEVNFAHERKFVRAAAAKAKCGAEIMNLTYREQYSEDPEDQWGGYPDPVEDRHWGVTDWARRSFTGAYFDWLVGNAILPAQDDNPDHEGTIKKVDRTTNSDLLDIVTHADTIQNQLDEADGGLNPLGLAKNVVPFDIEPIEGTTHFEQIYSRAVSSLDNALTIFNHANQAAQSLRQNQDSIQSFENNVEDSEADFNSRLIEIFGYPYPEDKDPFTGATYGLNYEGPDLYHWAYVDVDQLIGLEGDLALPAGEQISMDFKNITEVIGYTSTEIVTVNFNVVPGFGMIKPKDFTMDRKSPGEIQLARSNLIQAWWKLQTAIARYDKTIKDIEAQDTYLRELHGLHALTLAIKTADLTFRTAMNAMIIASKARQATFKFSASLAKDMATTAVEGVPHCVGVATDALAPARAAVLAAPVATSVGLTYTADLENAWQAGFSTAKEVSSGLADIALEGVNEIQVYIQEVDKLQELIRRLREQELEIYSLIEACNQASGQYQAAITSGARLLSKRTAFRQQTAESITNYRYKDMAYRIFRNDALQKYRAQFDMASMYAYLAAKTYGYETNLLSFDERSGEPLLNQIMRERTLGILNGSDPEIGSGLAGVLAELNGNFQSLKGSLGFLNPTITTDKFSLRRENFRIHPESATGEVTWRETLRRYQVEDLKSNVVLFNQYCNPFDPYDSVNGEPGIVIPFSTTIQADKNFFGWPGATDGGESFFPSDHYSIKIRGVGVWFSNYSDSTGGLATTPRCYLVPVGVDVLRVPGAYEADSTQKIKEWDIVDQILPIPYDLGESVFAQRGNGWMPQDQLPGTLLEPQVRKYASIRAHHDGGEGLGSVDEGDFETTTKLIGRSVWNTQWLLIIPGRFLLQGDPHEGVRRFIEGENGDGGVTDIRLAFQTYQYSSGLKKQDEKSVNE